MKTPHPTSPRAAAALCLSLLLAAACGGGPEQASEPAAAPGPGASPAAAAGGSSDIRFADVTAESGIDWKHNTGAFGERWLPETMGPGVVLFDADGDEALDILLINGRNFAGKPGQPTPPALYLNRGGLRFAEAGAAAGLDFSAYCIGGAAGDLDNDGDADLYLTCVGRDLLLRNDGGRFTEVGASAGIHQGQEFGAGVVFFDADRDGWLDIYATRYVTWSPAGDLFCSLDGQTKSYCTPVVYQGASPRFYRGRGDGSFEERTLEAGLHRPDAKTLAAVTLDLEDDGWPDLAVAGDTYPNLLYRGRGDGTFEEIGVSAGVAFSDAGRARGGMGIDAADYERSGRAGMAISYFANEMVGLYQNLGDGVFLDVAPASELGRATLLTLGWGCFFFDYDLDGWLDFFVANGHLDEQVENVQSRVTYAQPQQLFRNLGGGKLTEVSAIAGGDLARPLVARGAAFGDLDGDGDLDLVLTTNGGPAKLFENRGAGHGSWLRLALEGVESNRDGLGARVEVKAGGAAQTWLVRTGGTYLSQSQVDPTFGLGPATVAEEVVITWPSGKVQTLTEVAANQRLAVREGG